MLNIYFTAGYPKLNDTLPIMEALQDAGVDMIEIGIPYSDPLADGPTIQESSQQALQNGMTLELLFEQLQEANQKIHIPCILMGYLNPILQYGMERFCQRCEELGVQGLIIPDLPPEVYQVEYQALFRKHGLKISFLITPQTPEKRIRYLDHLSEGFLYVVADASITGSAKDIQAHQIDYFKRIQAMKLTQPRMIGFGISDHQAFTTACQYADGAIIGSAFIRAISASNHLSSFISSFIQDIRHDSTTQS